MITINKKRILSIISIVLVLITAVICTPVESKAASWHMTQLVSKKVSGESNFKKTWKTPLSGKNWTFSYGFNTLAVNEDCVTGKHNTKWHKSQIVKGGKNYNATAEKGVYGNREVKHTHSTVNYKYYSMVWK